MFSGQVFCGLAASAWRWSKTGRDASCPGAATGEGCDRPRRTNKGLHLAARLGLRYSRGSGLQAAIREELRRTGRTGRRPGRRASAAPAERLAGLSERRRKLLELYYSDGSRGELAEAEARLARDIESAREASGEDQERSSERETFLAAI